ncbi:MAG: hypothetical protein JNK57_19070 [Planctomycetaceae bacterium]|nr:hypothetical protein [Planctomycetaceae bacterium]
MKFKFKYLVAGTLACLTTLTPATNQVSLGFQADQPTLESLLRKTSTVTPLAPRSLPSTSSGSPLQLVTYLSQDQTGAVANPLAPRPSAPTPLLPARAGSAATPLPAPIVSSAATPAIVPVDGGSRVPIVTGVTGSGKLPNVPIITAPLSSNITSSTLGSTVGSGLKPTIDVTAPQSPAPILGSLPATIAPPTSSAVAPIAAKPQVPALPAAIIPAAPAVTVATPPMPTKPQAATTTTVAATPTSPSPAASAQGGNTKPTTAAADDEIQVSEISAEDLSQLMQSFGVSPKVPAISASTKERVETIGSGAIITPSTKPEPIGTASLPMPTTAAPQMVEPLYESYGLNLGHNRPQLPSRLPYDGYGTISGASDYLFTELLYMARDGGDFTMSYAPQQESYGFEPGMRMTLGRRLDSIEGREFGFTVMETMTSHTSAVSPTNTLFTWLQPGSGFNATNLSSFNNANYHHSFSKSHYHSAEYNRVNWNWDVMSTFIGLRYTGMDELYALHSVGGGGDLGAYRLRARNHMVGPQAGGTLHYDIGRKLSFSLAAKIAAYANFYQTDTEFANNSVRLMDVKDSAADLAWGTELACFAHYSLTPRARIKGGYELWFYERVATSEGQVTGFVSPFSGSVARNQDEAIFYGFSLGLELFR